MRAASRLAKSAVLIARVTPAIKREAESRAKVDGHRSVSDYVSALIARDAAIGHRREQRNEASP